MSEHTMSSASIFHSLTESSPGNSSIDEYVNSTDGSANSQFIYVTITIVRVAFVKRSISALLVTSCTSYLPNKVCWLFRDIILNIRPKFLLSG